MLSVCDRLDVLASWLEVFWGPTRQPLMLAALGAVVPELGRGVGTGIALWASRGPPAACPACHCEPTLTCPDLHCDCSGLRGDTQHGPSGAALLLGGLCVLVAGAAAGAAGTLPALRRRGSPWPAPDGDDAGDVLGEEARAQVKALRQRALAHQ